MSESELRRYSRHLLLPEVGAEGQRRLKHGKALIVGAGGLGSPSSLYLAAAGVGVVGLVDFDRVAESNLQRQVLYGTSDVGRPKLEAAEDRLKDLNPGVRVVRHDAELTATNALDIVAQYDVVLDGTDNYPARYLVNDACVVLGKPDVFGSVYRFEGQVSVFHAPQGPCYRCLFPEPPPPEAAPSCAEAGVLGVLPGLVGMIQATEAVKILLGKGTPLVGRLLLIDSLEMRFKELTIERDKSCLRCSRRHRQDPIEVVAAACDPADSASPLLTEITAVELHRELAGPSPPLLVDVRDPAEFAINRLPGAVLIPLRDLGERSGELRDATSVVVYCKMGGRSARATRLLLDLGFRRVRTLRGGLEEWAERVDPSIPRY
ncbi:MAG: molybdopterin-synthase adenylyltransferase MoeB [Thermoplasmata archaeon]|nr:molybdopterin-synthase adenylyltransferase MoeB [Thermoplasmata archaeon]MCI4358872.1 molybdopterin-synthase adenylyltransferase MoeB [Thermoplasmata archaeon]